MDRTSNGKITDPSSVTNCTDKAGGPLFSCSAVNKIPEVRIIPNTQIKNHMGIMGYLERVDKAVLGDTKKLKIGQTVITEKWISSDKTRIYFIPPKGIIYSNDVCLDGKNLSLEQKIFNAKDNESHINSMKQQMEALDLFLNEFKVKEQNKFDSAMRNAHNRYWKVLDHIENLGLSLEEQRFLLLTMEKVAKTSNKSIG